MEGWPRIPNPNSGSGKTSPRTTSTSLPAPGSTVVANVEDDLGEGMYSLRWAGQRINVSSRSPLRKGQALLLKSETSPEGKPRLVVLGPAPEQAAVTGRVIYGPNVGKKQAEQHQQSHNPPVSQSRVSGNLVDTDSRAGQGAAASGQMGGQMAAGVSKVNAIQAPEPMTSLIGQVLEPLPDLEFTSKLLLDAAGKEKERLEEQNEAEGKKPEEKKAAEETDESEETPETDGEQTQAEGAKKNRGHLSRPALAGHSQQPPVSPQPQPEASGEPARQSSPNAAATARPAPVVVQDGGPVVPAPAAAQPGQKDPPRPPQQQQTAPTPQQPHPDRENASAQPAASAPSGQQPAAPTHPAVLPGQPAPQPTQQAAQQPAPQSAHPVAPQPAPGTPVLENAGPIVPDVPADGSSPRPQPPQQAQPQPQPQTQTEPQAPTQAEPQTRPSAQQPAPQGAQPVAPQPAPGTPVLENAGPAVPDVPADGSSPRPQPQQQPQSQPQTQTEPQAPTQAEPQTRPSAQQPAPESAHPVAPQPVPETPVLENAGPVVPDVPADGSSPRPQPPQQAQPQPQPQPQTEPQAPTQAEPQTRPSAQQPAESPPPPASTNPPETPSPAPAQTAPPAPSPAPETPVPQRPAAGGSGIYPRPGTATYSRPTPQQNHTATSARPSGTEGAPASPPPGIKPETLLKEALGQMVGAAEIPLGDPLSDARRLGVGNKMPEAVLDKAASILLRGAGLSPDRETMDAAKALVANNVPVDRESVQALLSAAAGVEDATEREATLRAAARLLAKDIPLSPPLVSGMADVVSRKATAHQLMDAASRALAPDASLPEAEPLMSGARELLDMLHVDLERSDAPAALERYMSTFGREALGQALAMVETSAQALLENNPQLQKIDEALTAILTQLQPEMEREAPPAATQSPPAATPPTTAQPPQTTEQVLDAIPEPQPLPDAAAEPPQTRPAVPEPPPQQQPQAQPRPPQTDPQPPPPPPQPPRPSRPINAYLNAPKALPIEEMLKNLPPMPKVVSLGTPAPTILPGQAANVAANLAGIPLPLPLPIQPQPQQPQTPQTPPPTAELVSPDADAPDPEQIFQPRQPAQQPSQTDQRPSVSSVLNKLDSLFQTPGLNRPELELLRPGGFLDRFLNSVADRPDASRVKADAEKLLRELMSENPQTAARARRELPQKESAVLRETASRLTKMESDAVRADPLMNKLSDAATSLRDLGRQLLAVKAENLAGQDRNPGVMLAEVPFKLNDDAGDGRMQMFYRRGKNKSDGWSSRVILDLNTTRMGPVLGDMRFFGQDMTLNMFVDNQRTADHLSASAEDLSEALTAKGFRVIMKFMVLPPPPPPPSLAAERPHIADGQSAAQTETPSPTVRGKRGRLDIEM